MLPSMRVLVVLSFLIFSNVPRASALETNCFKSADIVCHLQLFIYCIDTVNKKITHGANFNSTAQQYLNAPSNPTLGPTFKGSLQTQLEITGADYGASSGRVIVYYLTLENEKPVKGKDSDLKNKKPTGDEKPVKILGKIKVDGDLSGDLDCHLNN
jgi:hypothetical protein